MNCPKCEGTLNIQEGEGHVGFICEKCKGMWLSNKYIESLKYNYNFEPSKFLQTLSESHASTKFTCPTCKSGLYHSSFNKIELEWCNTCNGVWFDKDELNTLVAHYKNDITAGERILVGVEVIALFLSS